MVHTKTSVFSVLSRAFGIRLAQFNAMGVNISVLKIEGKTVTGTTVGKNKVENVVVPRGIERIGADAFAVAAPRASKRATRAW